MNRARVLAGALVTLAVPSCVNDSAGRGATAEVADSAGVSIVSTRIGSDAPRCGVSAGALKIGSVDEAAGNTLFGVNDVAILGDGRIAVVNRGTSQIRIFSPAGDLVSEFGRQGGGPAEFKNLWSVVVRGEDTLVVGDYRPWRFSFFTPEGELLRRVELKPAVIERPDHATPLGAGAGFIVEEPAFDVQDEMVDRVVPLHVYGEDGQLRGKVRDFWLDRFGFLSKEIGYVGNPIFGARASFTHLRDDLIVYGTGRHEQLEVWTASGELRRIVRWHARERAVGAGEADVWRRQRRAEIEARTEITPAMRPAIDAQIGEHLPVAESYPGHDRVVVANEGTLWVKEYRRPLDEGPDRWWLFDEDGRFLCSASLPAGFWVMAARGDQVLGVVTDSMDVEYLVGYRLEEPASSTEM